MIQKTPVDKTSIYLAGPMRGLPRFNFDAFDAAAADLRARGFEVVSPADIDRQLGFDPDKHDEEFFGVFTALITRDVAAVLKSDWLVLLPGWEDSRGALAEAAVARWASKLIWLYNANNLMLLTLYKWDGFRPPKEPPEEDVLTVAARITRGERQAQYGPPDQDFARTAGMWSALKGVPFEPREVALFQILLKASREMHQRKRDNWVDIAGYARCGSLCGERQKAE